MSTSILQNDGLSTMSWQQVTQNQMVNRISEELAEETEKITEKYDNKSVLLDAQSSQLAKVKASINNAEIAVDNGEEGIEKIRDLAFDIRVAVGEYATLVQREADEGIDLSDSKEALITEFDDLVDQINRTADMYAKAYNPIGNVVSTDWSPNVISYTNDLANNRTEMTGTYVGSDFYIESTDGTLWVNDPGTSSIQQYTNYNTENPVNSDKGDHFVSTRTGLQLDSYDPATGAVQITVDPNNEAVSLEGTMHIGGTGLMQSWFYDLETEAGRDEIIAQIDTVNALLTGAESNLTGMKATIANDMAAIDKEMDALTEERSENMRNQMVESYEIQVEKQQEVQILQNTFSQMAAQQSNYAGIFQSVSTNPLLDVLI